MELGLGLGLTDVVPLDGEGTPPIVLPNPPLNIQTAPINTPPAQVTLTWIDNAGNANVATSYNVYRNGAFVVLVLAPNLEYVDTDVVGDTTYSYRLSLTNIDGTSPISAPVLAQVPADPI